MRRVLFLCTGNSARSLIAEGILRHFGADNYQAFSAGSQPTGKPNPAAIAVLKAHGIDTGFARSKSWDEFAEMDSNSPTSPALDIIITVCGNAADEACPIWPGHPMTAHWGVEDPAAITEPADAVAAAFAKTYNEMYRRIMAFLSLDPASEPTDFHAHLTAIGTIDA